MSELSTFRRGHSAASAALTSDMNALAEICSFELLSLRPCAIKCHALRARSWHNFDRPAGAVALHQTTRGVRTAQVVCTENLL
jgi:hypothetical protein